MKEIANKRNGLTGNVVVVNVVVRGRRGRPSWSCRRCLAPTSLEERWGKGQGGVAGRGRGRGSCDM